MVKLLSKHIPALSKSTGFGWKSTNQVISVIRFFNIPYQARGKELEKITMCFTDDFFQQPCDIDIQFGVHEGHVFIFGTIRSCSRAVLEQCAEILYNLNLILIEISESLPILNYSVNVRQKFRVTRIIY